MLRTVVAVFAFLAAFAVSPAFAEESKMTRMISVVGQGEVRVVPDVASVSIGVTGTAPAARDALDENNKAMTALMDVLKKAGIEPRDIATSNFSLGPRYDYNNNNNQPKLVGYDVSNTVTVTVRKIDDLGGLLDVAVTAGSNQINGIGFSVSKPEAALDEARKLAMADARHRATVYAGAGGFDVGAVLNVSETMAALPAPMEFKQARAQSADAVPVAQGEQVLQIAVNVTYSIK
jgi:uncharacterized protein